MAAIAQLDAAAVLEHAHDAFVAMDSDGKIVAWNRAATTAFGWQPHEVIGRRLSEVIIPEQFRRMHEDGLRLFLETGVGPVLGATLEVEGLHRDGHLLPVDLTITPYEGADGTYVFGAFLSDATDRRRLRRWQRASERVAWAIATDDPHVSLPAALLTAIGEEMDFALGLWWGHADDRLTLGDRWSARPEYEGFIRISDRSFQRGEGLPGLAWGTATTIWSRDIGDDPRYVRRAAGREAQLHAAVFIPALAGSDVVGVFEFLSAEARPMDDDLIQLLTSFGRQVGPLMAKRAPAGP